MKAIFEALKEWLFEHGTYKIVALLITLSLWAVIMVRKEQTLLKDVEIHFVIPNDLIVLKKPVSRVQFKVRGPRMAVKRFSDGNEAITVDLSGADAGRTVVRIYEDLLQLPQGVRVLGVNPSRVSLDLDRLQVRKVSVRPDLALGLDKEFGVRVEVEPREIEIQGAESALRQVAELRTENLDEIVRGIVQSGRDGAAEVELVIPAVAGLEGIKKKTVTLRVRSERGRK